MCECVCVFVIKLFYIKVINNITNNIKSVVNASDVILYACDKTEI